MGQQPNELTPYASPAHYWGAELRAHRLGRRMSLADLARAVHCDPSHLARIERGERPIPATLPDDCDRALQAEGALVRLYELVASSTQRVIVFPVAGGVPECHVVNSESHVANTPSTSRPTAAESAPWETDEEITVPVQGSGGRIIFVDIARRLFLQGIGAAGLGATALSTQPSAAFDGRPAEHFLLVRRTLADNDNLFGPRQVIPAATRHVRAIQQIRQRTKGADQHELLHVQTQFADLLGWLYQDSGDFQASQYWMDRSLEWSHLAADHDSIVFVPARKSQLAGDMNDRGLAVDTAEAALKLARSRSRVAAIASTYAAHGHALCGDRTACDRFYDQAGSLLSEPGEDDSPWGLFFDAPYVAVQRARSLAVLGDHRRAAEGFRSAIDNLQHGYHRDRGVYLAREALAHAGAGEPEHAAGLGIQALAIGTETHSGRIFGELTILENALHQQKSSGNIGRFHSAMADTVLRKSDLPGENDDEADRG